MENYYYEQIRDVNDEFVCSPPHQHNTFPSHIHRQMEVIYVVTGQNKVTINNKSHILTDNQLAIADSYDTHSYEHITDTSITMILPYYALKTYNEFKNGRSLSTNFIFDEAVGLQFKEIITLLSRYRDNAYILNSLINVFTGLIIKYIPLVETKKVANEYLVLNILKYIEDNFRTTITLESAATHFAYSKYYFSKMFNQLLGCHFDNYINMVRTQNVIYLIKEKNCPITEAILESGFSSIPTFYRFFKAKYGCGIISYLKKQKALEEDAEMPYQHFFK